MTNNCDFILEFIKHSIDKAAKYLGYNEVKELQLKVIAKAVSGCNEYSFEVAPKL